MPLNCSSLAARVPHVSGSGRVINKFTPNHVGSLFFIHHQNPSKYIVSLSNFNQSCSSSTMEDQRNLRVAASEPEKYYKELDVAVRAVQMACALCQRVQDSLISKTNGQVQSKDDNSPVTVAGNSATS
jgi:3'(2'), 5'-bisphosphate nucleotidase